MNIVFISIFIVSVILGFCLLSFSAWEARTGARMPVGRAPLPPISIRKIEKYVLYFIKHFVQIIVLVTARIWFLAIAKTKKFTMEKLPRFYNWLRDILKRKSDSPSFVGKMTKDLQVKIGHIKRNIDKEHKI